MANPFGLKGGSLDLDGVFSVGTKSGKLALKRGDDASVSVHLDWDTSTSFKVQLVIRVQYELIKEGGLITPFMFGKGTFAIFGKWRGNFTDDGLELTFIGSGPLGNSDGSGDVRVGAGAVMGSNSALKDKEPYLTLEAVLSAGTEDEGISVGFGPVSANVGGGKRSGSTESVSMTVKFLVKKPVVTPPAPEKKPVAKKMSFKVGPYEHAKMETKKIAKSTISDYWTYSQLKSAMLGLSQATRDEYGDKNSKVFTGQPIKIIGYADTTGPMSENDTKYAKGRAVDVKELIQMWTGAPDSAFSVRSLGEGKGATDKKADESKLAKNRFVEVDLLYLP